MAKTSKSSNVGVPDKPLPARAVAKKHDDYTSDGVVDTDVFLLPGSDYQIMILVTTLAAVVRLFRIYQPSSVVFDEVQYIIIPIPVQFLMSNAYKLVSTASEDSHRNTSRADSLWMCTLPLQNYFLHLLDGSLDSMENLISRILERTTSSQECHMLL
jgi:hypothetical protein